MLSKRRFLQSTGLRRSRKRFRNVIAIMCRPLRTARASLKAKEIAEAGFIYGLPIVMNYGVMYEFVIDKTSGQYKAPFNTIDNEAPRLHLQGHGGRHAEQRHALFDSCGWTCGPSRSCISVPAVDPKRYYSVQLCDGNTFNYGYIGSRATGSEAGDYLVVGPDWNGETPAGIKKVFRSTTQFSLGRLPHAALRRRPTSTT